MAHCNKQVPHWSWKAWDTERGSPPHQWDTGAGEEPAAAAAAASGRPLWTLHRGGESAVRAIDSRATACPYPLHHQYNPTQFTQEVSSWLWVSLVSPFWCIKMCPLNRRLSARVMECLLPDVQAAAGLLLLQGAVWASDLFYDLLRQQECVIIHCEELHVILHLIDWRW